MRQAIPQERLVLKGIGEEGVGGMSVNHHGPCSFTQCPDSSLDDGLFSVGSVEVQKLSNSGEVQMTTLAVLLEKFESLLRCQAVL